MTLSQFFKLQHSEHAIVLRERELVVASASAQPAVHGGSEDDTGEARTFRNLLRGIVALSKGTKKGWWSL